jgi:hypothetical protein
VAFSFLDRGNVRTVEPVIFFGVPPEISLSNRQEAVDKRLHPYQDLLWNLRFDFDKQHKCLGCYSDYDLAPRAIGQVWLSIARLAGQGKE